ncbi:NlpC/P60 family protein [Actinomadura chibensis]|uniref:Transglycosylase SLT domain-containing protein n=1 Tax=Actinomadura chibensis TaxID=392828 RepID=A0A5D0N8H8_9ACTN|nr:bifunctional lytic transglycosylase/C40 family peptidase [Actinomadura chibensis]TYB40804.1 transglycosylase SLT domain-containing protein [Actinomadura chibensis]
MPLVVGAMVVVLGFVAVIIATFGAIIPGSTSGTTACQPDASKSADIPARYLDLYVKSGRRYGMGWHLLAAVGKVESDHGRDRGPGITSGDNYAGAAGPMQFLPSTWAAFGVDGNGDGTANVYDPADAIPAAARYLKHNGAPERVRAALYQYNHSHEYVEKVLRQAEVYAKAGTAPQPEDFSGCGGALMALPAPSAAAAKAVRFARAQLGKPYAWGTSGPNSFDCSGLAYAAYRAAEISIPRVSGDQWRHGPHVPKGQEQPGDLVFFNSGPGTSTSNPGHVGLVIGDGKMIAAPHTGTVVQIQSYRRPTLLGFTRPSTHQQTAKAPGGAR